jgi:hypothetical protein
MIISHQKHFIYIHIYKVAGMSIRSALEPYDDLSSSDFPFYENIKFRLGKRFKFLSGWAIDHIKASKVKKYLPKDIYDNYFKFTFVRNPWDWQVSLYHYMLQYTDHPQHHLISKMKSFDEYIEWRVNEDLELQKEFIFDKDGKMIVDFVGHFEHLQEDFDTICSKLNLAPIQLPLINKSKHKPYKEYYNDATRKLIGDAFREDIEVFNYDF